MKHLVDQYIALRRAAGFKVDSLAWRLGHFARFAAAREEARITADAAVLWAGQARSPHARHIRMRDVVGFARFLRAEDPAHELPSAEIYAFRWQKRPPHLYRPDELRALLDAAGRLGPRGSSVPDTYRTLLGLLAATGLRIGEALRLCISDETENGLLIRGTKFRKSRLVPVHPSTRTALAAYRSLWRTAAGADEPLFISFKGTAFHYNSVHKVFLKLVRRTGLRVHGGPAVSRAAAPRLHDLRHTFAVRVLEGSPDGRDAIRRHMLALTTYLGHSSVRDTYWYLHVSPELMTDIADTCEAFEVGGGK